jgi:hypothetical protein
MLAKSFPTQGASQVGAFPVSIGAGVDQESQQRKEKEEIDQQRQGETIRSQQHQ